MVTKDEREAEAGKEMKKKSVNCLTFLIVVSLSFSIMGVINIVYSATEQPTYSVGDRWKYSFDFRMSGLGMLGTLTEVVTDVSYEISQFGAGYKCYELGGIGSGTVYGENITGTWAITGKDYYSKQDQNYVQSSSTTEFTFTYAGTGHSMTQMIVTKYNPPLGANLGFPLTTGKSWSSASTKTSTTTTTFDGKTNQETNSTILFNNYYVLKTESTAVSAGTFETFAVKETDLDGTAIEYYYSPKVGSDVKQLSYDNTGALQGSLELLEYDYSGGATAFPWVYLVLIWVVVIAGAGSIIGYALVHRKRAALTSQPTESPAQP